MPGLTNLTSRLSLAETVSRPGLRCLACSGSHWEVDVATHGAATAGPEHLPCAGDPPAGIGLEHGMTTGHPFGPLRGPVGLTMVPSTTQASGGGYGDS